MGYAAYNVKQNAARFRKLGRHSIFANSTSVGLIGPSATKVSSPKRSISICGACPIWAQTTARQPVQRLGNGLEERSAHWVIADHRSSNGPPSFHPPARLVSATS